MDRSLRRSAPGFRWSGSLILHDGEVLIITGASYLAQERHCLEQEALITLQAVMSWPSIPNMQKSGTSLPLLGTVRNLTVSEEELSFPIRRRVLE